jgi:hypothetical protein
MSMSNCIRSIRLPFGRFLNVGGKSETRLNQIVPGFSVAITNRVFAETGASFFVVNAIVYLRHLPVIFATRAVAKTFPLSLLSMLTVSGPPEAPSDFA